MHRLTGKPWLPIARPSCAVWRLIIVSSSSFQVAFRLHVTTVQTWFALSSGWFFAQPRHTSCGGEFACTKFWTSADVQPDGFSTEPLTRELRMKMAIVSMTLVQGTFLDSAVETHYRDLVYCSALSWFLLSPTYLHLACRRHQQAPAHFDLGCCRWSYGSNKLQIKLDTNALSNLRRLLHNDRNSSPYRLSAVGLQETLRTRVPYASGCANAERLLLSPTASSQRLEGMNSLLDLFLASELQRLEVWERPLAEGGEYTKLLPHDTTVNSCLYQRTLRWLT